MAWSEAVAAIRARVATEWTACPVAWPNEAFIPPEPLAPWLYIECVMVDARIAGIGSPGANLFRDAGLIRAFIHVPSMTGEAEAQTLAAAFVDLFRTAAFDGVQCWAPRIFDGMPGDDAGNWWQVPVTVPFSHDYFG